MSKQVAVILAGCGGQDGTEIHETTLTLLRLDQLNIGYRCFAPDIDQARVADHLSGEVMEGQTRNVLVESARLAGGAIAALDELDPDAFDGAILPGGLGVTRTLSNFDTAGADMTILPLLRDKLVPFHEAGKPLGLMCYAPVLVPRLLGEGIAVTVGQNAAIAGAISSMGGLHKTCRVDEVTIDREHRVVTTPAYMLAERIGEIAPGIFKLVDKFVELMD